MSDQTRRDERREPEPTWPGFALPRGTMINGYRIERILGSGGFGITYLALDLLQQRFAIKEYYPQQFATRERMTVRPITTADAAMFDDCRERFLREAQALVLLGRVAGASEGIVRVQTYFEAFGTCFLVMDYIEGTSLANVFRQEPGGLPAERVRSLLTQLLSSIRFVHQAGLVHRDIKPANVIVRDGDRLMLIDFGATRQATPNETATFTQIYSGGYGPPEQMLGHRQGEFSDIYAIGAVCYRAIGGRVANALARRNSLAAGMPDPQPTAASIGAGRYPPSLLAAIDAALSVEPERRPQSADAMLAILGPDVPPPAVAAPVVERGSRRRGTRIAAAAGAVALAAVAYLALRTPVAPPPPKDAAPAAQVAAPIPPPPAQPPPQEAIVAPPAAPAAQPPRQEAIVVPPPAPAAQPPQQEAIVVPPPAPLPVPEPPSPLPAAPRLDRAQVAATSLPCSALQLAADGNGVRASGFAPAGQDLDWFLAGLRDLGRVSDDVTRVDRWACPVLTAIASAVRGTWDTEPQVLALRLDQPNVTVGARLGISVATALPALYVDLYQADGSVRHLFRSAGAAGRRVEWIATPPQGARLLVALGAAAPLDLGARPDLERATDYLDALRPRIGKGPTRLAADLAMVMVGPAEPVVAREPQLRPAPVRPAKCANILSRAQLGETLSDAELAALRTECRS